MRVRLRTRPAALFGAMLLVALVAFLPLRLVLGVIRLGDTGFSARAASGSVWAGQLRDARFGELGLGDMAAHVSPWGLLLGRARVDLATPDGGARSLHGAVTVSRHAVGLDDLSATLPAGALFQPLPITALDLDAVTLRFDDESCEVAEGRVRATLAGDVAGVPLGQAMSGALRCDGAALLLPLASQAGDTVDLRLWSDGRYTAALTLHPADGVAAQRLEAAGFLPGPGGHRLSVEGHL